MTDRVAIVTGASGGIGRAVAVRLAQEDMAVVVHYAGNRSRAQETVDEVANAGGRAMVVAADVAMKMRSRQCSTASKPSSAASMSW